MSEQYFDEDDLINDYIEEAFEPPPPDDYDDFLAENESAVKEKADVNEARPDFTSPTSVVAESQSVPTLPPFREIRDILNDPDHENEVDSAPKKDLFKFERYQGTSEWRKTTKASSKSTGSKNSLLRRVNRFERKGSRTVIAPEVQLVNFLHPSKHHKQTLSRKTVRKMAPKPGVKSIPMTLADGTRIHVEHKPKPTKELLKVKSKGHMLGVSMSELMRRSNNMIRRAEHQKQMRTRTIENDNDINEQHDALKKPTNHQLWVDKHAPTVFSHLLSDERTNREVLRALLAWDPYVFHREPPARPSIIQQNMDRFQTKQPEEPLNPNDLRPSESNRVILLSGPPGVGKTTLAHIVARHAGYRPLEVNASDERSAKVLKERVVRAMESATLNLTSSDELMGRPNCLILDEIDGADAKGAVEALVELIRTEIPANKKGKKQYLRRPIIFICNHKYAPALRPLLPFAKQFEVAAPQANRLVARLRAVLSQENLSLMGGSGLLHKLVTGSAGDIRSCLYTLQFASARAKERAREKQMEENQIANDSQVVDISNSLTGTLGANGNGLKDQRTDIVGTVTAVFRKLAKKRLRGTSSKKDDVNHVLGYVQSFGEHNRTLDCLFANLLGVSYVDPTLDRCFSAHEWLSSSDLYRSQKSSVASNNHMEHHAIQMLHIPSCAAAIHFLCRVETRTDLVFSAKKMVEARFQLESNSGLVQRFVEGLAPKSKCGVVGKNIVTETIPYALWMLSAGEGSCALNRTVSSIGILNQGEKLAFASHVAKLRTLGLTYVPQEEPTSTFHGRANATPQMRLEPQIDQIVKFEGMEERRRRDIPSVLKELLAHGVARAVMKERETNTDQNRLPTQNAGSQSQFATNAQAGRETTGVSKTSWKEPAPDRAKEKARDKPIIEGEPVVKRQKTRNKGCDFLGIGAAKAKAAKSARKAASVGFEKSKKVKLSNTGSGEEFSKVVRFKFCRGFTQAVRTPCKMEDLT